MKQKLSVLWQYLLPHHALSRLTGWLANCETTWFKNWAIKCFIKRYGVDMSLALEPDFTAYPTFNAFFTRALKPGVRPIVNMANAIACPADGGISQLGIIENGRIFQAKGHYFNLAELLGGSVERAKPFLNGKFATIYLAPKDYHRVHMPMAGKLEEMVYIPGRLFSVNKQSAAYIPQLFARNERVVATFRVESGYMSLVLVGAMIVAGIETVWAGLVAPSRKNEIYSVNYSDGNIYLHKGDEMGRFQLGSTVIALFSSEKVQWDSEMIADRTVILGEKMGEG